MLEENPKCRRELGMALGDLYHSSISFSRACQDLFLKTDARARFGLWSKASL